MWKPTPHYSGPRSHAFWREVDRLPEHQRGEIYTLGVVLQRIEDMILSMVTALSTASADKARTPDDDKA